MNTSLHTCVLSSDPIVSNFREISQEEEESFLSLDHAFQVDFALYLKGKSYSYTFDIYLKKANLLSNIGIKNCNK